MIKKIYDILLSNYGNQNWWPVISKNSKEEIIIGAILTQNTSWRNVERAVSNLKRNNLLNFKKIGVTNVGKLADIIRPSGYYNQKARKLKALAAHLKNYRNVDRFLDQDIMSLRTELLGIYGIGPETADSIILYAANKPVFVVDTYTSRIFSRVGLINDYTYDKLQQLFMRTLPKSARIYNQYHALIVRLGKDFCRPAPLCTNCPINRHCDYGAWQKIAGQSTDNKTATFK